MRGGDELASTMGWGMAFPAHLGYDPALVLWPSTIGRLWDAPRVGRKGFVKRLGLIALVMMSAICSGRAANADTTPIFGSQEAALGPSRDRLSFERYQKLLVSSGLDTPGVAHKWQVITNLIRWQTPLNKLKLVQQYFNTMPYRSDQELYGRTDYWANVGEFLSNGGDCEDYAIAKYRALVEGGFDPESLRIVLLHDRVNQSAHAVLAAYLNDRVWILDNQIDDLVDQGQIGHYDPDYSLNAAMVWRHDVIEPPQRPLEQIELATRSE
ncbi:MAG: hypothetical protein Tsb0016_09030 [Sphingomonadales bacterium]